MHGMSDSLIEQIMALTQCFGIAKPVLFGSRAQDDFRAKSDIVLDAYDLHLHGKMPFLSTLDGLPALLKHNMIAIRKAMDSALLHKIKKD